VVVASPSTEDPNYFYSWRRDTALVFKNVVDTFVIGGGVEGEGGGVRALIDEWVSAEGNFQNVQNPSGGVGTGGLGEPKFYVNETAWVFLSFFFFGMLD
jgi:glucoamylase